MRGAGIGKKINTDRWKEIDLHRERKRKRERWRERERERERVRENSRLTPCKSNIS